jgi:hypothetical protein
MFYMNEHGKVTHVPVLLTKDLEIPGHVDVKAAKTFRIRNKAGEIVHFDIVIPGVRDRVHSLEVEAKIKQPFGEGVGFGQLGIGGGNFGIDGIGFGGFGGFGGGIGG